MSSQVVMYASAWCGYCYRARSLLQTKGVQVEELVIDGNTELRREMIERTGKQTVPQIFIDGRHIGGSEELLALERAGQLDVLLAGDTTAA